MPSIVDEASQLIPSQFAHLKTTNPATTSSGIAPGRALFDAPSPGRSPPVLPRSQRTRKPSAKKAEASQSQPTVSRSKGKGRAETTSNHSRENTTNNSILKPSTNRGPQASSAELNQESDKGEDEDNDEDEDKDKDADDLLSPRVINLVEEFVGHSIDHLSHAQIRDLLNAMPETQASAMGTQAQLPTAITESVAGVGLACGDRNGYGSHEDPSAQSILQGQKGSATTSRALIQQKRPLEASNMSAKAKRVRISQDGNDSLTEDESDEDSNSRHQRRTNPPEDDEDDDDDDDDDEDDDDEPLSPLPPPLPQSRIFSASSQGQAAGKGTHSRPTHPVLKTAASAHSLPRMSTNPLASSSLTNPVTTHSLPFDAATYLAQNPPPKDLNNLDALAAWAIQIAKQQTQEHDNTASISRSNPPTWRTTTANHITRAIASHRSQINGANHPDLQDPMIQSSQAASASSTASGSAPSSDNTPVLNAGRTPGRLKPKHSAKPKLSDYPGVGEVASAAIPYFLATVFAEGAYENLETFRDWALDSYQRTWDLEFPEQEYEAPPKAVLTIMTRRVTWLRGEVKKRIRVIVQYGYGFQSPATSREKIKSNRRLAKKLGPNTFHCRDLVPNTNHFENAQFIRAIGASLFWDPESLGVVFRDRFEVVPIPAVALVLTMIQVCIDEWRQGSFKANDLDANKQQVVYEHHLLSLYQYENTAAPRLTRFRKNWFVAGMEYSGAKPDEDPNTIKAYVLASDIRPITPPPNNHDDQMLDN